MSDSPWNRCDACGRFIPYEHFDGRAVRRLATPDSESTGETFETVCEACVVGERQARAEIALNADPEDASACGLPEPTDALGRYILSKIASCEEDEAAAAILQHPVVAL
jgi:hypothetical protein